MFSFNFKHCNDPSLNNGHYFQCKLEIITPESFAWNAY
jgi:hypothetical protein